MTSLLPEDNTYLHMLDALLDVRKERAKKTPDFELVLLRQTTAKADHAELRVRALRLQLITREEADKLAQVPQDLEAKAIDHIAEAIAQENVSLKHSHSKIASRRFPVQLERIMEDAIAGMHAGINEAFREGGADTARGKRIDWLLANVHKNLDEWEQATTKEAKATASWLIKPAGTAHKI